MRHRLPSRAAVLCTALALTATACADSPSGSGTGPAPLEPGSPTSVRLLCRADVRSGTVRCAEPGASGIQADRILGTGTGMKLTSSNITVAADTFAFDMTVSNGLSYPVGTVDGVNADSNGMRVFIVDGIHTTVGSGSVTVANADGVGAFTATGQPYFAYPGILQPDSTTPAHRWKFRFDPGVEQFTFGMYLSVPVPPGGGGVWMKVTYPFQYNPVVADSVVVRVRVDSASASIASVHASAAGRRVRLLRVSVTEVGGTLQLAGLPAGPLQVVVDAGTIRGDTGRVTFPIIKDSPPKVTITAPREDWVAAPNMQIDVECVDDNPAGCASISASVRDGLGDTAPYQMLATGTTHIHANVNFYPSLQERAPRIDIYGRDSRGQIDGETFYIYVQSSPSLVLVDSAGSRALDLDSTRLLFADASARVWSRRRPDGTRTMLTGVPDTRYGLQSELETTAGRLYPLGALFALGADVERVYDWRDGTVTNVDAGRNFAVAGNWAIWSTSDKVVRRDILAGTNVTIPSTYNWPEAVAENGDVVLTGADRDLYRYRDGVTTRLTTDLDSAHWNLYPITDGTNVIYLKTDQLGSTTSAKAGYVTLWRDGVETRLGTTPVTQFFPWQYAVKGGWIAYQVADGAGFGQIRTRAPDGTDRLATFTGASNNIAGLGPDGTLVFSNSQGMYVVRAPYTAAPTRLGRMGGPVFRNGELFVFLGNSVFKAIY